MNLKNKRIVLIGGSSGIGFAVAKSAVKEEAKVIISSRSEEKLAYAKARLNGKVMTESADMRNEDTLKEFFNRIGVFDHLLVSASEIEFGPIVDLPIEKAKASFDSKFWGPYLTVKNAIPYINKNGSVTLFSGAFSRRPKPGTSVVAAINSAIEGLSRSLALELSPIRVNVVAPGLTDTEHFDDFSKTERKEFFTSFCDTLPIKRPAKPEEIAQTALYLIKNNYTTGETVFVDGGYTI